MSATAHFLPNNDHAHAFMLCRGPTISARAGVLMVPPFAEEMMKARQQFTRLAFELEADGIASGIIDVNGTGDAPGTLDQATWQTWTQDVANAYVVLRDRTDGPIFALGLRLGALLALDACAQHNLAIAGAILWEPQFSGKQALRQFMRIAAVNAQMQKRDASLTQSAHDTTGQEVGGYWITTVLADSISAVEAPTTAPAPSALVIKISEDVQSGAPPVWDKVIAPWRESGAQIQIEHVAFPAFWTTPEIITSAALTSTTCDWIRARLTATM